MMTVISVLIPFLYVTHHPLHSNKGELSLIFIKNSCHFGNFKGKELTSI